MKDLDMWNDVSMNTLVNALVCANEFQLAEDMLRDQANSMSIASNINGQSNRHNVEACTVLIDGYAKNGELGKALQVLQYMKNVGIEANELSTSDTGDPTFYHGCAEIPCGHDHSQSTNKMRCSSGYRMHCRNSIWLRSKTMVWKQELTS